MKSLIARLLLTQASSLKSLVQLSVAPRWTVYCSQQPLPFIYNLGEGPCVSCDVLGLQSLVHRLIFLYCMNLYRSHSIMEGRCESRVNRYTILDYVLWKGWSCCESRSSWPHFVFPLKRQPYSLGLPSLQTRSQVNFSLSMNNQVYGLQK